MWINLMVAIISQYIHISKHLVVYLKYIQFLLVRYTSIFTCQIYLNKRWGKGGMDLEEPCFLHNTLTGHSLRISFFEREHQELFEDCSWVTSLQLEAQSCLWGPKWWGGEVTLVHSPGGWDLEGTMSLVQQEVALVALVQYEAQPNQTQPTTTAFTKTPSIWTRGEKDWVCILLKNCIHVTQLPPFIFNTVRRVKHSTEL